MSLRSRRKSALSRWRGRLNINRNGSFDQLPSLRPIPRARVVSPLQAWCLVSCGIRESANLLLERFSRPRR